MYDVIVIGGGPAGMSGALVLARCRRKVLICDTGKPRNRWAKQMNGFLTMDGVSPQEFLDKAKKDLSKYTIEWRNTEVINSECHGDWFSVELADGTLAKSKKLLIATGLKDNLPPLPDIEDYYGKSVHHCPYCDAYECKDKAIIAYGKGAEAKGLALSLKTWSSNVTLCTDGFQINNASKELLERNEVKIETGKIIRLIGKNGIMEGIEFTNGNIIPAESLFFVEKTNQQSQLSKALKCTFTKKGVVKTDRFHKTNIKGLYVAGDADKDMQQVIVAASEGAKAGININKELQEEERK
jgi:thioredoxin reductase